MPSKSIAQSCAIDGCEKLAKTRGWCDTHYRRYKRHGDPLARKNRPNKSPVCIVDGCESKTQSNELCAKHWTRQRRHGSPDIALRDRGGPTRFVERAASYRGADCLLWPHQRTHGGYGQLRVGGIRTYAHRVVLIATKGPPPFPGAQASHSCGNPSCVSPMHLRWDTHKGNHADRLGHGKMGYKLTDAQAAYAFYRYHDEGVSMPQIGLELGVTKTVIRYSVRNMHQRKVQTCQPQHEGIEQ